MVVRCERCRTEYEFDASHVNEAGVAVKCTSCGHVFKVQKRSLFVTVPMEPADLGRAYAALTHRAAAPAIPPPSSVDRGPPREWRVRQANGSVFTLRELTTLQKWIVERKVTRDDEISLTGENWKRLGNIAELATFFQVVDEAQKAQRPETQPLDSANPNGESAPVGGALPEPAPNAVPSLRRPDSRFVFPDFGPADISPAGELRGGDVRARRAGRWGGLVLLLAVSGALGAGYSLYWLPRERAQAAAARAESERQASEMAAANERVDAKIPAEPQTKAGGLASAEPTPRSEAQTTKVGDEANARERERPPSAEAVVGGSGPPVPGPSMATKTQKPEPPHDFNWYMAQGDKLRGREKSEAALDAYGKASDLEPDRVEPIAGRGLALLDMGSKLQAEAAFLQALRLNPRYGLALMGLAETYRALGKNTEAVEYYQKYLELLPDGSEASVARSAIKRLQE